VHSGEGVLLRPRYALADASVPLAGDEIARDDGRGISLYRVQGPLRVTQLVAGLYADGWAGRHVEYVRFRCDGGYLHVRVQSDPRLFRRSQTVVARAPHRRAVVATVGRFATETLIVPLSRAASGNCRVQFDTARTAVPADVEPDSTDRRALALRFLDFRYSSR
jgi:hypothetical protein